MFGHLGQNQDVHSVGEGQRLSSFVLSMAFRALRRLSRCCPCPIGTHALDLLDRTGVEPLLLEVALPSHGSPPCSMPVLPDLEKWVNRPKNQLQHCVLRVRRRFSPQLQELPVARPAAACQWDFHWHWHAHLKCAAAAPRHAAQQAGARRPVRQCAGATCAQVRCPRPRACLCCALQPELARPRSRARCPRGSPHS